jgi:signal transduction histidine kinase
MWEKIVLNLVSNAFKFTLEGSIRLSLRLAGPNVELKVTDTGSGIAENELPHLFERFHRVEGARGRSMEGSGRPCLDSRVGQAAWWIGLG